MYDDLNPAQIAEVLEVTPPSPDAEAAAARTLARHAHGKEDLALLLDALGLTHPDTPTAPPTLLSEPGDATVTKKKTTAPAPSAFEGMALSMHHSGAAPQAILEATGVTEAELTGLLATHQQTPGQSAPAPTSDIHAVPVALPDDVRTLLGWATTHPAAGVRSRAARITADLSELSERRASEAAQREAEEKVAKAKAELEQAQQELRAVKASTRTTAAASSPMPIRAGRGSGRTREELASVRAWARENGHQVAAAGSVPKQVLEAYDAAHRASPSRKAS